MSQLNPQSEHAVLAALDRYASTVRRICFLYAKCPMDVDDIFQDVFLRYMQQDKPFTSHEHEKAWVIRVTINCCKDFVGSFWRRKTVPLDESLPAETPAEHRELLEAVQRLPDKERMIIYLFYYEGYAATEIAMMMNLRLNTVYSHLHRARARLRMHLEDMEDAEPNPGRI